MFIMTGKKFNALREGARNQGMCIIIIDLLFTAITLFNDYLGTQNICLLSLLVGRIMLKKLKMGPKNGRRCRQMVIIRRWSLTQA